MAAADGSSNAPSVFTLVDIHRYAANFLSVLEREHITSWEELESWKKPRVRAAENAYIEQYPNDSWTSIHYVIHHSTLGTFLPISVISKPQDRSVSFTVKANQLPEGYTLVGYAPGHNIWGVRVLNAINIRHFLDEFRRLAVVEAA